MFQETTPQQPMIDMKSYRFHLQPKRPSLFHLNHELLGLNSIDYFVNVLQNFEIHVVFT